MCGKWLCICGGTSEEQNGCQKQSTSTVKTVKHGPLPAVSGPQSLAAASITSDKKEGKDIGEPDVSLDAAAIKSDKKEARDIGEQDVNKAAEEFINKVHKAWELQRALSDSRYNGYLERAM